MGQLEVQFNSDDDGFISQQCPNCDGCFKIDISVNKEPPTKFCPYCKHENSENWLTTEQVQYAKELLFKKEIEPSLEKLDKSMNEMNKSGSMLTFSSDFKKRSEPKKPTESNDPMRVIELKNSGVKIKIDPKWNQSIFNILTGESLPKIS